MMNAKDGSSLVQLTSDEPAEGEPILDANGQTIAFTSNRFLTQFGAYAVGDVRHLCVMDAAKGQKVIQLTQSAASSGTKERPQFHLADNIYYLDGGRLISVHPNGGDPKAVFPHAEMKRENRLIAEIFEYGGVVDFAVNEDETFMLVVIKREYDQICLIYDEKNETPAILAKGKKIVPTFLPDGKAAALVSGGIPLKQPIPIGNDMLEKLPSVSAAAPSEEGIDEGKSRFVLWNSEFMVESVTEFPIEADGIMATADGTGIVFWKSKGADAGLAVMPFGGAGESVSGARLAASPIDGVSVSPDGKQVAYISKGRVYVVPMDGSVPPIAISPEDLSVTGVTWSPAVK
jgi:Tol biopolymer transport system component